MVSAEKRVLVVDDEQIVRESCKHVLTDAGYVVRTVANGRDALKACRAESFDMMLTDLKMPDMDGLEVVRAVVKEFPEVRTVIITGYPSPETAEQGEKLGIFDYLRKPLSPERFSAAAAAVLARPARRTAPVADVAATAVGGVEQDRRSRLQAGVRSPRDVRQPQDQAHGRRGGRFPGGSGGRLHHRSESGIGLPGGRHCHRQRHDPRPVLRCGDFQERQTEASRPGTCRRAARRSWGLIAIDRDFPKPCGFRVDARQG